jgi:hypothetical protein
MIAFFEDKCMVRAQILYSDVYYIIYCTTQSRKVGPKRMSFPTFCRMLMLLCIYLNASATIRDQ